MGRNVMLLSIFLKPDIDEVLDNFYKFPRPDEASLKKRDKQVKQIIEDMGHKYRLARPMPKVKA
jgi:hypothetical protein